MPKKSKRVPCNRYLNVALAHTGSTQDSHYLDIAKLLSQTNRRLYRQGKVYRVKSITVVNSGLDFQLRVAGVPNTWVSRNAWKRGKKAWDKMNSMALEDTGSSLPRWHDFKVFLSTGMTGDADQVNCIDVNGNASTAGEWNYSEYVSPDGGTGSDTFMAYFLGDHTGSAGSRTFIGLIQSYAESRSTVGDEPAGQDTDGDDDPLANLFDDGTHVDEILAELQVNNDQPPYAGSGASSTTGDEYPGAGDNMPSAVVFGITSATDIAGGSPVGRIGSFDAVCGLIEFETTAGSDQSIELLIELAPGDYKGVHAEEI